SEQLNYLDHERPGREWKLFTTPEPLEITENFWRFKFTLPAKQVTQFVVKQQHSLHHSYALTDTNDQQLTFWLEQRYLDAKTAKVLRQVVEHRQQTAGLEEQIQRLEKERDKIHAEQKRIRENLQALGDRSSEKELRERFVRTLNVQEDRLEQIEKEIREQINKLLAELEYEASLEK